MSIYLSEIRPLVMYKGQFAYPINMKDRKNGSIIYLLTPNIESSLKVLNYKNSSPLNSQLFKSYYLEKSVDFIINNSFNESGNLVIDGEEIEDKKISYPLLESFGYNTTDTFDNIIDINNTFMEMNLGDKTLRSYDPDFVDRVLEEDIDDEESYSLQEETLKTRFGTYNLSTVFKSLLYDARIRNQKDVLVIYERVKKAIKYIKYAYSNPKMYKNKNLFYDLSYYTKALLDHRDKLVGDRGVDIFKAFIRRYLLDTRFSNYESRTLVIPIHDWVFSREDIMNYKSNLNPISVLYRSLRLNHDDDSVVSLAPFTTVFLSEDTFFKINFSEFNYDKDFNKLFNLIKRIVEKDTGDAEVVTTDSKAVILNTLANKLDKSGITIDNISGDANSISKAALSKQGLLADPFHSSIDIKKAALVDKMEKIADTSDSSEEALDKLENDDSEWINTLLMDLQSEEKTKMTPEREKRYKQLQNDIYKKTIDDKGTTVGEILDNMESTYNEIPETSLNIDSIDDHWNHVKFQNFNEAYTKETMRADILAMFMHFNKVTHPMNIVDINLQNTSTSEDYKETYTVKYEDAETGKRFTMKLDMPIMLGNRFMKLRGNEKVLIGQLMLLPIVKTDEDTVQIVSNYNKIFVRRKSPSGFSKSSPIVNKLCKVLNKYTGKEFKVITGDNRKVCSKYVLPITYVDMASIFSAIQFPDGAYISFNMDNLKDIPIDRSYLKGNDTKLPEDVLNKKYLCIYVNEKGKKVPIVDKTADEFILVIMCEKSEEFVDLYNVTPISKKLMFTEASILNADIPIIICISYALGLQAALDRIGIKYEFQEKRPRKGMNHIKFADGYLVYHTNSDADNLLMNGLMQADFEEYSIREINTKDMWLGILDDFGGRVKADGLDNFYDLMFDPITVEICDHLNLPNNYIDSLIYASNLLIDNKYNRHADLSGNRLRINEVIVAHLYHILSKEYGRYRNMIKRNKGQATFSAKQSAVIDSILNHDQTSSDLSTLSPLLEAESGSKVTFKGLSGMNSERAFSMEKRVYDESMLGVLSLSTGFANTVGINRQTTVDAGVINKRGFIKSASTKELDNLSTLSIMEAMSPLATNRDDPMRTAMAFTQTVQHQMTVKRSMPNLITTGADEALPHITSDKFAFKAKDDGVIKEVTDDYILVKYKNGTFDYIDIREKIQKNSDGGFFITTKLDLNPLFKKGSKFKARDILAYNRSNYDRAIGTDGTNPNDLTYAQNTLAKIAILPTDLGFEDSCVVDEYLSYGLGTEFCVQKEVALTQYANIFYMVEAGTEIKQGEPLIIFSDNFEDEDSNELLASISKDSDILSDIGRKQVHAKVSGKVQDIKIYRTCDSTKLSPSLKKHISKYESKINKLKKIMSDNKIDKEYELESTEKLPMEGKLKNVDGVLIEFYIKTNDNFSYGDKLVFLNGLKGVCSMIISKEDDGYSDYRPEENVNAYLTATGVFGRMVSSVMTNGLINKGLIELTRQCQEDLGIEWRKIQDIISEERKK